MSSYNIPLPEEKLTIVSIYPLPLDTQGKGMQVDKGQFKIPAAPAIKGEKLPNKKTYQTLEVGWGSVLCDTHANSETADYIPRPVKAEAIAQNLVNLWAKQAHKSAPEDGVTPGVAVLPSGETKPSEELLQQLQGGQEKYFTQFVHEAYDLYHQRKFSEIGDMHRVAAKWLGLGDDPWHVETMRQQPVIVQQANSAEVDALKKQVEELKMLMTQGKGAAATVGA